MRLRPRLLHLRLWSWLHLWLGLGPRLLILRLRPWLRRLRWRCYMLRLRLRP